MNPYELYMHYRKPYRVYAWTKGGVCFTARAIAPMGWVSLDTSMLAGFTAHDLRANGFRKQNTHMTQEQLSRGWLV